MSWTMSRLGLKNGGSDADELFLTQFTGEVLAAYQNACKFAPVTYTRTVTEGKSARFDAIGNASASYVTVGQDLTASGQQFKNDKLTLTVDGKLVSHVFIDEIDEAANHYDVRGKYSEKMGMALAQQFDINVARTGILAARSAATVVDGSGGTKLINAAANTSGSALEDALYLAQQSMDEKNVAETGRYAFLRPAQYRLLAQRHGLLDTEVGGTGSVAEGQILKVAGFTLVKTNNLPSTNVSGTYSNKYDGDFRYTYGLCMTEEAVGTVKLMDLTTEGEWLITRQATILLSKYVLGHGILRPECAVEIATQ